MTSRLSLALAGLALAVLAGCAAPGASSVATGNTGAVGTAPAMFERGMLVDAKRLTLYSYDTDKQNSGKSSCYGTCATNWPPFLVPAGARASGDYSVVPRDDGGAQWAYKGWPLYYWPEDQEPGDVYGDNYQNVWHIVKP